VWGIYFGSNFAHDADTALTNIVRFARILNCAYSNRFAQTLLSVAPTLCHTAIALPSGSIVITGSNAGSSSVSIRLAVPQPASAA
jgi:hypothetical protein